MTLPSFFRDARSRVFFFIDLFVIPHVLTFAYPVFSSVYMVKLYIAKKGEVNEK
jgi:hypothetical protein